jgi:flavin reductase (DIM6/NTAB) family NADH-FMN oxidoreductase RutF
MKTLDPAKLSPSELYGFLIASVVPRPIAWVSTQDLQGRTNLAPFSFFNGVGSEPLTLMFAISRKSDLTKKHTLRNIEATREFVVNIVSSTQREAMHQTSADYPDGVSEFDAVGLQPIPSLHVKPPRVGGSKIQFECILERIVDLGDRHPVRPGTSTIVIGEVVCIHADPAIFEGPYIDVKKLDPVARLGGRNYTGVGPITNLPAAKVPTP